MGEETKSKEQILYVCDPDKNTECKKTCCVYNPDSVYPVCQLTSKKEYAKDTQTRIDNLFCVKFDATSLLVPLPLPGPFEGEEE